MESSGGGGGNPAKSAHIDKARPLGGLATADELTSAKLGEYQHAPLSLHWPQRDPALTGTTPSPHLNPRAASASRWRFERRFAKSRWLGAKKYFEAQQAKLRQPASSSAA